MEQAALKQHGLFKLADFLPKKPGDVELKVIKEMFEASVDGEAFDMERWGQYFKPAGMGGSGSATGSTTAAAAPKARVDEVSEEDPPFDADPPKAQPKVTAPSAEPAEGSEASSRAADIIAMIRKRQQT
jgi:hypothetical protein